MVTRANLNGKNQILVGDSTSHGGVVVSGSPLSSADGLAMARKGDTVTCPRCKPHLFEIAEGLEFCTSAGAPLATEGHHTTCGAVLIAQSAPAHVVAAAQSFASGQGFDEQVQFIDQHDRVFAQTQYTLYSGEEILQTGSTDEEGKTARIFTDSAKPVTRAVLVASASASCCALEAQKQSEPQAIEVELQSVVTNSNLPGESVVRQTVPLHERPLTAGEINMAKQVFGNSLDYSKIRVHNHAFIVLLGFQLQTAHTAMTPRGEIYYLKEDYSEDFSALPPEWNGSKAVFIHEMTHVWQYQLGYLVMFRGTLRWTLNYQYVLDKDKKFCNYDMEGQGNIIADYFFMKFLHQPRAFFLQDKYSLADLPLYERILSNFITNPSDTANLPVDPPPQYENDFEE